MFGRVVSQVQKATGCTRDRAQAITMEAHTRGRAIVIVDGVERCRQVKGVLEEIGLCAEIDEA